MTEPSTHLAEEPHLEDDSLHLRHYLRVLLRYWKLSLALFLVVFAGVAVYTFIQEPVYRASALLEVRKGDKQGSMLGVIGMESEQNLAAEIEVLESRSMAAEVVRELSLNWHVAEAVEETAFDMRDLEVESDIGGFEIVLLGSGRFKVQAEDGRVLAEGQSGWPFAGPGLNFLLTLAEDAPGDRIRFERTPLDAAVAEVQEAVTARESGRNTNLILVSAMSTDPRQARDMVNTMTDIYRRQSVVRKSEEAGKTVDFIDHQLGGLRTVLDRSEQRLQEYKIDSGMITLGPEGSSLVEKIVSLEQQKVPLDLKIKRLDGAVASVRKAIAEAREFTPPLIEGVPAAEESAGHLAELEAEKKELLSDFTSEHPAVIAVGQKIRRVLQTLLNTYRAAGESLRAERQDLDRALAEYEGEMEKIPEAELELARMTRDQEVNAELYTFLLQKQQEARIAQAATISNVKIIDPAITPRVPVKPDKKKNLMLGGILGLMLGAGLAFFLDYMNNTVKESDEAARIFGRPVLSVIPCFPPADGSEEGRRLITLLQPKSPTAEAFRSLRTSLHFVNLEKDKKVILVTSSFPNEGKTTTSTNLAIILAQTGDRVLLIGADLRRPSLHEMFDGLPEEGLTEMLVGTEREPIQRIEEVRLDVLGAGSIPPNPSELIGSNRMGELLKTLRERYDYIVIDGPPTLPVTDSQLLSGWSDMVLAVLEPGRVDREAFARLRDTLAAVDAPVVGLVLNDKSGKGFKHYGSYSYYGHKQYGGYYG